MDFYVGMVMLFSYSYVPPEWMACDGRLLKISGYAPLFSLIGTYYGGDGKTTFALPNLNGTDSVPRAAGGQGAGPGRTPRPLGQVVGAAQQTLSAAQTPPHGHAFNLFQGASSPMAAPAAGATLLDPQTNGFQPAGTIPAATMNVSTIVPAGGGGPHPNDQPWLALVHCICWRGIYPSFTA